MAYRQCSNWLHRYSGVRKMITKVKVYDKVTVQRIIENSKSYSESQPWYLISIYSAPDDSIITAEAVEALRSCGCLNCYATHFWDISNPEQVASFEESWNEIHGDDPNFVFTKYKAQRIITFIDHCNRNEEDVTLIMHCDAGISRSGAVGRFAIQYLRLKDEALESLHPLHPNLHVLTLLKRVSGLVPSFGGEIDD